MTKLPWIKLYTDIIDNPWLGMLAEEKKWRYVQLLALAGECDAEGYLVSSGAPLGIPALAWRLRIDEAVLAGDLQALSQDELVTWDEQVGAWFIPGFAESQMRVDNPQREKWREQKRRQRLRQASPASPQEAGADEAEGFTRGGRAALSAEGLLTVPAIEKRRVKYRGQ